MTISTRILLSLIKNYGFIFIECINKTQSNNKDID